jgi:soluble lytic murein transglycosylase-like protein
VTASAISAISSIEARIGAIQSRLGVASRATAASDFAPAAAATTTSAAASATATPASFDGVTAEVDALLRSFGLPIAAPATSGGLDPATPFASSFESAGARWGISPTVLAGIGWVESRFQVDALSSAGAQGMMQFLPSTAAAMGVDPYDPAAAIEGAARYLRGQLDRFGSIEMAVAAYNVGPGAIAAAGGILPGSQAARYVDAVFTASGRM